MATVITDNPHKIAALNFAHLAGAAATPAVRADLFDFTATGKTYTLNAAGTLDWVSGNIPNNWKVDASPAIKHVQIGTSVASIGAAAFWGNQLTSITIPTNVTSIANQAFEQNQLASVTIPDSITSIANEVFASNTTLATVNCYITKTLIDGASFIFLNTTAGVLTINARATDETWTAGAGQTIGGRGNVTVVKGLP
jgi:hypothetical protein